MRKLGWKIGVALLTFFIGTVLALSWFVSESKPEKRLEILALPIPEVKPLTVVSEPINPKDPSYLQGRKDAARDVKSGKFIIRVKGVTLFGAVLDEELSKYKIEIQSIGCSFKDKDEKHLRGYNEISKAAIENRIGKNVFDEAMRKATEKDGDASQ